MTLVSVVIATRGRPERLARSLAAVRAAAERVPGQVELLVVDDGPDARTEATAASHGARYLVAADHGGGGPGDARNIGVRAAGGALVAFTDDDTRCADDWLAVACARLDAEPGLAGLEGAVVPVVVSGDRFATARVVANRHGGAYLTANLVLRRDAIMAAGGFERLHRGHDFPYREDTDLALRVIARVGPVPFEPALIVEHPVDHLSLRSYLRTARYFDVDAAFARRHPGYFPSLRAAPAARLRIRSAVVAAGTVPLLAARRWRGIPVLALAGAVAVQQVQIERDLAAAGARRTARQRGRDVAVRTVRCALWAVIAGTSRIAGALRPAA